MPTHPSANVVAEPGHLTLSLGLSSLAIIVVRSDVPVPFKIAAAVIFVLSGWATALLYWSIFAAKFPATADEFLARGSLKGIGSILWLGWRWFRLVIKSMWNISADELTELGFLHLLAAIGIFWFVGGGLIVALFAWEKVPGP